MKRFQYKPHEYVAHYTRIEIALGCILKNNQLRLGPFIETNDPRETKTWMFSVGFPSLQLRKPSLTEGKIKNWIDRRDEYDSKIKHGYKILCVSQDDPDASGRYYFQHAYDRPRMWAQYAGNHTGVCLLFRKRLLNEVIEQRFSGLVTSGLVSYGDIHMPGHRDWDEFLNAFTISATELEERGFQAALEQHRDRHLKTFFFQKNKDWETEAEFRWIVRGETNDPEFIPIDQALHAIVVGMDFPAERIAEVHEYSRRFDAHIARAFWVNGEPKVRWFAPSELSAVESQESLQAYNLQS